MPYKDPAEAKRHRQRYYAKNQKHLKAVQLQYKYGIDEAQYQRMFQEQRGLCAICHMPSDKRLHVDHCHTTKHVRALLCYNCNLGIGHFKDNPEFLYSAAAYLVQFNEY